MICLNRISYLSFENIFGTENDFNLANTFLIFSFNSIEQTSTFQGTTIGNHNDSIKSTKLRDSIKFNYNVCPRRTINFQIEHDLSSITYILIYPKFNMFSLKNMLNYHELIHSHWIPTQIYGSPSVCHSSSIPQQQSPHTKQNYKSFKISVSDNLNSATFSPTVQHTWHFKHRFNAYKGHNHLSKCPCI